MMRRNRKQQQARRQQERQQQAEELEPLHPLQDEPAQSRGNQKLHLRRQKQRRNHRLLPSPRSKRHDSSPPPPSPATSPSMHSSSHSSSSSCWQKYTRLWFMVSLFIIAVHLSYQILISKKNENTAGLSSGTNNGAKASSNNIHYKPIKHNQVVNGVDDDEFMAGHKPKPPKLPMNTTRADESFAKLHFHVITEAPPLFQHEEEEEEEPVKVHGFAELKSTIIRSLDFFWPKHLEILNVTIVVMVDTDSQDSMEQYLQSSNDKKRKRHENQMTQTIRNMFSKSRKNSISVKYEYSTSDTPTAMAATPVTTSMVEMIQRLWLQFWADNFTTPVPPTNGNTTKKKDADDYFIGLVEEDTIFTRALHSTEFFDYTFGSQQPGGGRPRVIAQHAASCQIPALVEMTYFVLQRPILLHAETYFPVVVYAKHLQGLRQEVLKAHNGDLSHSYYVTFDDFFWKALVPKIVSKYQTQQVQSNHTDTSTTSIISFYSILLDYIFHAHFDDYDWHFEESEEDWGFHFATMDIVPLIRDEKINQEAMEEVFLTSNNGGEQQLQSVLKPFPRSAIHAKQLFPTKKKKKDNTAAYDMNQHLQTVEGRKYVVSSILREGYCYSLPETPPEGITRDELELRNMRCSIYSTENQINTRGEWTFEEHSTHWLTYNRSAVIEAHIQCMERNIIQQWNEDELKQLFFTPKPGTTTGGGLRGGG